MQVQTKHCIFFGPVIPPPPRQDVLRPSPSEMKKMRQLEEQQKKQNEIAKSRQEGKKMQALAEEALFKIEKFTEDTAASATSALSASNLMTENKFKSMFPHEFKEGKKPIKRSYVCMVHNNCENLPNVAEKRLIPAHLFVTSTDLCICSDDKALGLSLVLPLTNIVSIQKVVVLKTSDAIPCVMPIPDDRCIPDGLRIYTRDHKFMDISQFKHEKYLAATYTERVYALLNNAWRSTAQVPDPSFVFADASGIVRPQPQNISSENRP